MLRTVAAETLKPAKPAGLGSTRSGVAGIRTQGAREGTTVFKTNQVRLNHAV